MTATDDRVRHVAVIMASPASGRSLLGLLSPLFESGGRFEVQGVFLEDADAGSAAGLPFVKEVCRVTFSVREFTSDQFERSVALSVRTARRTFSVLAARTGQPYSFRNVRGSGGRILGEAAEGADITVFEPAQLRLSGFVRVMPGRQPQRRILALLADTQSAPEVLETALQLAAGDSRAITVLLAPADGADTADLRDLVPGVLPRKPAALRYLKGDPFAGLCDVSRELGGTLAVLSARFALERPGSLQRLRAGMPCPVCLVSDEAVANAA
ncbi:MAG: hypothetical protein P8Y52_12660 [Xanthomonadales bacterium]